MSEKPLETFIVTGASSGIGRELAICLAAPHREIWLLGRDRERLEEAAGKVREQGGNAKTVTLDLADLEASGKFLEENFPAGKPIAEVYLSAAVTLFGEVQNTLHEDWDRLYLTNLMSPVQWTQFFYSRMVEQGSGKIVLISSLSGYTGYPTATAYATMKGGLLGLFRSLWYEAKAHGVSIHLASPGYVRTRIYQQAILRGTTYEQTMKMIEAMKFPMMEADEIARLIIKRVGQGKPEFALPAYASLMKWISPRMPGIIGLVHKSMMKRFRQAP